MREIVRRCVITGSARVSTGDGLLPTALARVRNSLVDFRREAAELGADGYLLVAMSGVRTPRTVRRSSARSNGPTGSRPFSRGGKRPGWHFAVWRPEDWREGRTLVLDVGGGSTELVLGVALRSSRH